MTTPLTRTLTPPPEETPIQAEFTKFDKKSKRHGHGQDVTDANDVRQVAGCLPLDLSTRRVLLISSRKQKDAWVIPKGGWEKDETQRHAAQRETWEEAGIKGTITKDLGVYEERTNKKKHLKAHHWIFEMNVEEVAKKWPERKKRDRRWFTFEEAIIATSNYRYIQEAILQSSLNPKRAPPSPKESVHDGGNDDISITDNDDDVIIKEKQQAIATTTIKSNLSSNDEQRKTLVQSFKSIFL